MRDAAANLIAVFSLCVACLLHSPHDLRAQSAEQHIGSTKAKRVKATLTSKVTYQPSIPSGLHWSIVTAQVPEMERQADVKTSPFSVAELPGLKPSLVRDTTALRRAFYTLAIPTGPKGGLKTAQGITIATACEATLYARKLVPGAPEKAPAPLTATERRGYLAASNSLDFPSAAFQQWLKESLLRRQKDETDLAFAFRAFKYVREHVPETGAPGIKASEVCRSDKGSSCGGCSVLFCAVLRANGIPARSVWGRWATSRQRPEDIAWHVKAEFYAEGIGWVPADPGAGRGFKIDPKDLFGKDRGDFIAFHIDPDVDLPDGFRGSVKVVSAQSIMLFWMGAGRMDNWKVEDLWDVEELNGK